MIDPLAPPEIRQSLGDEKPDLVVKAARAMGRRKARNLVVAGLLVALFAIGFALAFAGPVLAGGESRFEANGIPVTASRDNLGPLIGPVAVALLFAGVGVVVAVSGLRGARRPGPWVAATGHRLVLVHADEVVSHAWTDFTGTIRRRGTDLELELRAMERSGSTGGRHRRRDVYRNKRLDLAGLPDAAAVEQVCLRRIRAPPQQAE